jgi:hypothetical protein
MRHATTIEVALVALLLACGGHVREESSGATLGGSHADAGTGPSSGSGGSSGGLPGGVGMPEGPVCDSGAGWECAVDMTCGANAATTLKGKVFDPAGIHPLPGVAVFIPMDLATVPPLTRGTSACTVPTIGDYVTVAITDATGAFTLSSVPTGRGIPLVVELGKWRRTTTVDITTSCATTTVPDGTLRLPRNRQEGEMPQMALLTGGCDDLGCFLTNIGIDPAEFSAPHAGGAVDVYQGLGGVGTGPSLSNGTAGDCTTASCPLWANKQSLESYDVAILSCECAENAQTKPPASMQALHDWLDEGGKVLASHSQATWFRSSAGADFRAAATWLGPSAATSSGTYDVNTSFALGSKFGDWLKGVGVLAAGQLPTIALDNVASSVSTIGESTDQWIYDPSTNPHETKMLTFETPIGGLPDPSAITYCGGVAFTDFHSNVGGTDGVKAIPAGCIKAAWTPAQAALEYLFFHISGWALQPVVLSSPPPPG